MAYQGPNFYSPLAEQIENSQEPSIKFSIVSDEEGLNDDEDGNENETEAQDREFRFFGEVIQLSDDDDDFWSDSSSDPDSSSDDKGASQDIFEVCGALGAYYRDVDNKFKTVYRYVKPDYRNSCNITAAALKEPVSLLTKYRSQRFQGRSRYFRSAFSGPPKPVQWRRQRSPLLIDCPRVHNKTIQ